MSGWRLFDRRYRRIAAVWIATILVATLIDRASLLVAPCGIGGGGYSDQKDPNDDNCAIREGIVISGIELLDERAPETWTAIASFAIAIFTWTLWRSSEKMWKVTNLNVQAAIDGERAHLYVLVTQHNVSDLIDATSGAKYSPKIAKDKIQAPIVAYVFKNSGKTPAILEEIMHGITIQKTEKHTIHYTTPDRALEILAMGQSSDQIAIDFDERPFLAEDAKAIGDHDLMLFFYTAATFRDIFNRQHKIRHDFLYSGGRFHLINRIEKTYDAPEQEAEGEKEQASRTGFFGRPT